MKSIFVFELEVDATASATPLDVSGSVIDDDPSDDTLVLGGTIPSCFCS